MIFSSFFSKISPLRRKTKGELFQEKMFQNTYHHSHTHNSAYAIIYGTVLFSGNVEPESEGEKEREKEVWKLVHYLFPEAIFKDDELVQVVTFSNGEKFSEPFGRITNIPGTEYTLEIIERHSAKIKSIFLVLKSLHVEILMDRPKGSGKLYSADYHENEIIDIEAKRPSNTDIEKFRTFLVTLQGRSSIPLRFGTYTIGWDSEYND